MRRCAVRALRIGAWAICLGVLSPPGAVRAGALAEQTISLHPGWNAVFVEVQPESARPEAVFQGLPLASVWGWIPRATSVQFLRNPGEQLLREQGWHVWFPAASGKAALGNLFAVRANRCYLIEVAGDADVTLTLRGEPVLRRDPWIPDSFNLTGFPVDPAGPPTFAALFAGSAAHAGQPVYRLDAGGSWALVGNPASTPVRPGEAFWVYTGGASEWVGPLSVQLDYGNALEFGTAVPARELRIRNTSGAARTVTLQLRSAGTGVPLARRTIAPTGLAAWTAVGDGTRLTLPPLGGQNMNLAVRRAEVPASGAASLLEISDGAGSRLLVPVSAGVAAGAAAPPLAPVSPHAGLWVGMVTVDKVTQAQIPSRDEFTEPQPTGFEFAFKLILHVDAAGQTRLLKEVTQLWDPAAAQYVLVTDDSAIPGLQMAGLIQGQRLSTAAFDFVGRQVACGAGLSPGGAITCTVEIPPELPTNPFRHEYHPDHNNRDELDRPISNEAISEVYRVNRRITLQFAATSPDCGGNPSCVDPPDWWQTRAAGTYREALTGLHRNPIAVAGTFALRRVSEVATLDPTVTP